MSLLKLGAIVLAARIWAPLSRAHERQTHCAGIGIHADAQSPLSVRWAVTLVWDSEVFKLQWTLLQHVAGFTNNEPDTRSRLDEEVRHQPQT